MLEEIKLKISNKIRLKLIKLLLPKRDISRILISLGITEEEYAKRYNNPKHAGYQSQLLIDSLKDLDKLQIDFGYMLGINYRLINKEYKKLINS